ncbi:MAG: ABC transporter permease [Muribaculaceae bacterium]
MSTFTSIIHKESKQLVRDRRTMMIVLLIPVVLLVLFGFAISTEVNNIDVAVVTSRHTDTTRDIVERLKANSYFTFKGFISHRDIESALVRGDVDAVVVFDCRDAEPATQVIVDASNTTVAKSATAYLQSVVSEADIPIVSRTLYNPQLKSSYNFVPGILGMIFILICAMMTSVSIVREKETGTMDLMMVSPVKPHTIVVGKLVPYFALSCLLLGLMLVISYTLLDLPIAGSIGFVVLISLLYIILSLAIGLLVSTMVNTQVSALLVSAMMFMIPVIMLSGMIFPIDNMPEVLQWLSTIIPARWYIDAMRKLMIQQLSPDMVLTEVAILAAMTALILTMAIRKFKSQY